MKKLCETCQAEFDDKGVFKRRHCFACYTKWRELQPVDDKPASTKWCLCLKLANEWCVRWYGGTSITEEDAVARVVKMAKLFNDVGFVDGGG